MDSRLSSELRTYLIRCGLSHQKVSTCDADTRLFHDLGIYGEIAEDCLEELHLRYQVDLSEFNFAAYFPPDFPGGHLLARIIDWLSPFTRSELERFGRFKPLTLGMIDDAIRAKRLAMK